AAAYAAGWSVKPTTPRRKPSVPTTTGARARAGSGPAPTQAIPAPSSSSKVSSSASAPKSSAWLFASVTQSTPRRASASTATGGARKKNVLRGSGQGRPRSDTQHSRFSTSRSASRAAPTTPAEKSAPGPADRSARATPRPSIVSPASPIVTRPLIASRSPLSLSRSRPLAEPGAFPGPDPVLPRCAPRRARAKLPGDGKALGAMAALLGHPPRRAAPPREDPRPRAGDGGARLRAARAGLPRPPQSARLGFPGAPVPRRGRIEPHPGRLELLGHAQVVLLEDARDARRDGVERRDAALGAHRPDELLLEAVAQALLAEPERRDRGHLSSSRRGSLAPASLGRSPQASVPAPSRAAGSPHPGAARPAGESGGQAGRSARTSSWPSSSVAPTQRSAAP